MDNVQKKDAFLCVPLATQYLIPVLYLVAMLKTIIGVHAVDGWEHAHTTVAIYILQYTIKGLLKLAGKWTMTAWYQTDRFETKKRSAVNCGEQAQNIKQTPSVSRKLPHMQYIYFVSVPHRLNYIYIYFFLFFFIILQENNPFFIT